MAVVMEAGDGVDGKKSWCWPLFANAIRKIFRDATTSKASMLSHSRRRTVGHELAAFPIEKKNLFLFLITVRPKLNGSWY